MTCNGKTALLLSMILTLTLTFTGCGSGDRTGGPESSGSPGSEQTGEVSRKAGEHTVTHIDGREIRVPDHVERIAAVYGPSYEMCVALGAEDRIVAAADVQIENFPWAEKVFRRISGLPCLQNVHSSVSFEELQKYSPDLVLTFNRPNELNQLEKAGIPAVSGLTPKTLDEEKALVQVYGEALGGTAPERAQDFITYFDEKRKRITDRTSRLTEAEKPAVYYAGVDLLTTYGKQSDLIEVIEAAGGRPVTKELNAGNHTSVNYEQLASWDPEYIFIDHGGMNDRQTVEEILEGTEKNSRYQSIRAVKNQNMYLVPSGVFYWDMGLQKILLVEYMAKILHPDLFDDLNMAGELKEFYSRFFSYELSDEEAQSILERKDPADQSNIR